ncbi:heat stress transcription factor A-5-like [Lolium rigidum]|uniref:heat stress transcription factor A-5-like n=1 Tax=Lolium rigidum TaxID=89674 RepID=UPI001F5DC8DF|nr:heat stress transcription factor A-5-like [Lolium rigidum]
MEASGGASGGGGGGGGGPAPFLLKTYEMVDDPSTDVVVSWSDTSDASFVVWNSPEFAARLLPTYFKHSNFSSFIRQLNTYGFRKVDPERWEFANEYFVKGQKHLLKNIYRRKPIHSHSHQPGALPDNERSFFEDEIDRLAREKANLQAELWKFKQQQSGTMFQIEDLEQRVLDMEQRQGKMIAFLQQASKNPLFVQKLVKMAEASSIFSDAFHKKRRLSGLDHATGATEATSFYDDHSTTSKQEMGNLLNQHFSDKLKLGLCPTMTENNLITLSAQSSHEDNGSPHGKHSGCNRMGTEDLPLVPQTMELSDTGTSICPTKDACFTPAVNDEGLFPCHLSLTLASCSMGVDRSQVPNADVSTADEGSENPLEATKDGNQNSSADVGTADPTTPRGDAQVATELAPAAPPVVVNDKFWEQFLTERPGCCETEDASSGLRSDPPMDKGQTEGNWKDGREDLEQLKL